MRVKLTSFERQHTVTPDEAGLRLDQLVAGVWADFSRSRLSQWIKSGEITVNGQMIKPRYGVQAGDEIGLSAQARPRSDSPEPQAMDLDLLYVDDEVVVINKPAGLVVHPGSGNPTGTLVNALLHWDPSLATLPRAGLVHRLDKETSGCLMVARSLPAHTQLVAMLKDREIKRQYIAIVWGEVLAGGSIDEPIGRHRVDRTKQMIRPDGRRAITHYRLRQRLQAATALDVTLETGRTHQIRVHLAHVGYPIIGDPVYGRRGAPAGLSEAQRTHWQRFPRQALHAHRLSCAHPVVADQTIDVTAPLPEDMASLMTVLALPESANGPN